ncbi:MAG: substrate-binding domain-containing protein [Myxococcota bacterium]
MKRNTPLLMLFAFIVISGWVVFTKARSNTAVSADPAVPADPTVPSDADERIVADLPVSRPEPSVVLPLLHSSEKEAWLRQAVDAFEAEHPEIDVELESEGSLDAVYGLLAGEVKPVLWSPADRLAVNLFTLEWKADDRRDPFVRGARWPRSLVMTPMVFVAWESRAALLADQDRNELTWKRLAQAVSAKKGWAGLGGEAHWGAVKFGHTDPMRSNSGLQTLVLMAYSYHQRKTKLSPADVTAPRFEAFMRKLERNRQASEQSLASTAPFMKKFVRDGTGFYDLVMVYESVAISELSRATGRWGGWRVLYPPINLWSDNPIYLLDTEWVTPEQKHAAQQLVDYLMSEPVQRMALEYGYRPGNLDVPVLTDDPDNPFKKYASVGVRVDVPRVVNAPSSDVLLAITRTYARSIGVQ